MLKRKTLKWILYCAAFAFVVNLLLTVVMYLHGERVLKEIPSFIFVMVILETANPLYYFVREKSQASNRMLYMLCNVLANGIFSVLSATVMWSFYTGWELWMFFWVYICLWIFVLCISSFDVLQIIYQRIKQRKAKKD